VPIKSEGCYFGACEGGLCADEWIALGEHRSPRINTSEHIYFANDQLAVRFIAEIDFDYAAVDANRSTVNGPIINLGYWLIGYRSFAKRRRLVRPTRPRSGQTKVAVEFIPRTTSKNEPASRSDS